MAKTQKNSSTPISSDDEYQLPPPPKKIMNIFGIAMSAFALATFVYFINFHKGWGNQEQFGQFGDFLGGTLGPFLSFLTIALLIWSIRIQMHELNLTRNELKASADAMTKSAQHQEEMLKLQTNNTLHKELSEHLAKEIERFDTLIQQPFFPNPFATKNNKLISLARMKQLVIDNPDSAVENIKEFFDKLESNENLSGNSAIHIQLLDGALTNIIDTGVEVADCTYSKCVKTSNFLKIFQRIEYARLLHLISEGNAIAATNKLRTAYNRPY